MGAGADSFDLDVLRYGGMSRLFTGVWAGRDGRTVGGQSGGDAQALANAEGEPSDALRGYPGQAGHLDDQTRVVMLWVAAMERRCERALRPGCTALPPAGRRPRVAGQSGAGRACR